MRVWPRNVTTAIAAIKDGNAVGRDGICPSVMMGLDMLAKAVLVKDIEEPINDVDCDGLEVAEWKLAMATGVPQAGDACDLERSRRLCVDPVMRQVIDGVHFDLAEDSAEVPLHERIRGRTQGAQCAHIVEFD